MQFCYNKSFEKLYPGIFIMSEGFAVFILMSNYFHDVATAMLLAAGAAMWIIMKTYERMNSPVLKPLLLSLSRSMIRIVWVSIAFIVIGLVLRLMTLRQFEWANAVNNDIIPGLVAKYIIATIMLAAGMFLWIALIKKLKDIAP